MQHLEMFDDAKCITHEFPIAMGTVQFLRLRQSFGNHSHSHNRVEQEVFLFSAEDEIYFTVQVYTLLLKLFVLQQIPIQSVEPS